MISHKFQINITSVEHESCFSVSVSKTFPLKEMALDTVIRGEVEGGGNASLLSF
jgi:hypothetical protein